MAYQVTDGNGVHCKQCGGSRMRRLPREGFWQKNVYAVLGYYPWECPVCRETQFFRVRGLRGHRTRERIEEVGSEMYSGDARR